MSQLATKWVYDFGGGASDGDASMKNLLGGKGANLAEMAKLGLPVPPGFTITTEVCTVFYQNKRNYPAELQAQVADALKALSKLRGPVDAFFDKVTVNADDKAVRENRLKLLSQIRDALNRVADFSRIEG